MSLPFNFVRLSSEEIESNIKTKPKSTGNKQQKYTNKKNTLTILISLTIGIIGICSTIHFHSLINKVKETKGNNNAKDKQGNILQNKIQSLHQEGNNFINENEGLKPMGNNIKNEGNVKEEKKTLLEHQVNTLESESTSKNEKYNEVKKMNTQLEIEYEEKQYKKRIKKMHGMDWLRIPIW